MKGRPILGVIAGLFFGIFLAITLLAAGVIPLGSVVITALPIAGVVLGLVLAAVAPIPRRR